jgi:phosphoglycolate phosphatase-like HAD superfamily hydrolase
MKSIDYLKNSKTVFWDFDGVIKDSVKVKSEAFEQLFSPFGNKIANKVRSHHEENGGMSRFDKLPIYLGWAEQNLEQQNVDKYEKKFSLLVKEKVINSDWVAGIYNFLKSNYKKQQFFLLTATPQQEIEDIVSKINISDFFIEIIGSPVKKKDAIKRIIVDFSIDTEESLMIGDSDVDYEAAVVNKVPFILRKTNLNKSLQKKMNGLMIKNYKY